MASRDRILRRVGLVVLVLTGFAALVPLFRQLGASEAALDAQQFLLPALSFAVVVLALALGGVLIRNLVRLVVERKRGLLGSRLRTKLVFFFLALVLLPAAVLFYGSAEVINETVEAILRTPMENIAREAREIVSDWNRYFRDRARRQAVDIAEQIAAAGESDVDSLDRVRAMYSGVAGRDDRRAVRVTIDGRVVGRFGELFDGADVARVTEVDRILDEEVDAALGQEGATDSITQMQGDLLAVATHRRARVGDAAEIVVAVAVAVPSSISDRLGGIDAADRAYRRFRVQRRELVRFYLTLTGLIFLVTLFVATWIGFYLSRRITVPVQQLAAASREISAGNLDVRVKAEVGDEMGMLIDAFNEMASELQENREVITRSTADLRRSNRALDDRRRYIETLLANLSTAVISLDPQGRVTTTNPAVETILGVSLVAGDDARALLGRHGLEPIVGVLDASPGERSGEVRREVIVTTAGGVTRHVSVQVTELRGGERRNPDRLVMVEDLSEMMRAQRVAAWREIARRIAHEIKNPLTPIQLAAQRLRKKFNEGAPDLGDVLRVSTDSIEHEVGALKRLVDEFSRFARMPEISPREVVLAELVESAVALYRGQPGIEWDIDIPADLPTVELDPDQMRRVFINLADNALAALGGRGRIEIRAKVERDNGLLRIEFEDDGPGVPSEDRERMFAPYFSTKSRGTGLGLAIVHRVVTDHRGSIRVEGGPDDGARFVIEIPL